MIANNGESRQAMIIRTENLTKTYGRRIGCEDICLSVPEGQIFGFLGPNGAGKSTLVKTLVGLLHPTSGRAFVLGKPLGDLEARKKIGFLPENFRYHDWLTGEELLDFHASLYGLSGDEKRRRIPEVLEIAGLSGRGRHKIGTYSKGMQQRIGIACALLPDPQLLFLDEPTSALDPLGRREVREIILELKRRGKTVFLNSHLLSEVEMICDRVAIIKRGRIVAQGSIEELLNPSVQVEIRVAGLKGRAWAVLAGDRARDLLVEEQSDGENKVRMTLRSREEIPSLVEALVRNGGLVYEVKQHHQSLEDLFVELVRGEGA